MADLTQIQVVHEDGDLIMREAQAFYEQKLNRQLAPADLEMLLISGLAYRELLIRAGINDAARQNLVDFARDSMLEYLGALVGVSRLPASPALCTIQFNLVDGHNAVTIPQGLRVQSTDGQIIFQTIADTLVQAGVNQINIQATAQTPGLLGNGYAIGKVNIILDPQAYLSSAQNIDITSGGADAETDDELRSRIKLAPAVFSVAGPRDAYKYFAKSASQTIVDVAVTSPVPGQVNIYPLCDGGVMPSPEILTLVQTICNADKVRPLTDTVITGAPTKIDFAVAVDVTLLDTADAATEQAKIFQALSDWKASRQNKLGLDVIRNRIAALSMTDKTYNVNVTSPVADIVADDDVFTNCTGITVNIIGNHGE